MNTISPSISEFGIVDHEIDTPSTHRHCRSRNFVKPNASAIQSDTLPEVHGFDDDIRESLQVGVTAARRNMPASIMALAVMTLLLVAYTTIPSFAHSFNQIAVLKMKMGWAFPFLAMGLSVGFLSEFLKVRKSETKRWTRSNTSNFLFVFLMFGIIATAKDPVYQLLAQVYGDSASLSILSKKVLFELFAWTLLLCCPAQTLLFSLKAHGFSMKSLRAECPTFSEFFAVKVVPMLIANWSFWLPASVIIYCFPTELQLVSWMIAMSIWVCSLHTLTKGTSSHPLAK
jgi:hypothetical protein